MAAHVAFSPFNLHKNMAILKQVPDELNEERIEKIHNSQDEIDKPKSYNTERTISDENARNQELFDVMKYEVNRLNSFTGKWPLCFIKPTDLAQNGFFYLQSEDKVQCAFCNIIIDNWNVTDKPVKKHMMKSPKCSFLMTTDAGNVPLTKPKSVAKTVNKCIPSDKTRNSPSNKAKYPRMSDLKNRLLSYRDWPLLMLSSRQLAECGLFYTGVGDAVTCFYCGGSLGNWELNDDPWVEHEKFYPDCGFLDLVKTHTKPTLGSIPVNNASAKSNSASAISTVSDNSVPNEVIRQAGEIFPVSMVKEVAIQHFRNTGKHFTSLHDLCEAILRHNEKKQPVAKNTVPALSDFKKSLLKGATSDEAPADNTNNIKLICKICLDEEINTVFEPCHHQVACEKCSQRVTKCPLCRRTITNRIKVFWG